MTILNNQELYTLLENNAFVELKAKLQNADSEAILSFLKWRNHNDNGNTALHIAFYNADTDTIKLITKKLTTAHLLEAFAAKNNGDFTPLGKVLQKKDKEQNIAFNNIINAFNETTVKKALLKSTDGSGQTILHELALEYNSELLDKIMEIAQDNDFLQELLYAKDNRDNSPIHIAALEKQKEFINKILTKAKELGIVENILNYKGEKNNSIIELVSITDEKLHKLIRSFYPKEVVEDGIITKNNALLVSLAIGAIGSLYKFFKQKAENSQLRIELETLRKEKTELDDVKTDNIQLKVKLENLEKEKAGFDERIENIGSENSQLKTKLENLRKEKAELDKIIENIGSENTKLKAKLENLEKEKAGFDERIENIGSENSQLKTELETLRKEKTELDKRIENIGSENTKLKAKLENLEKEKAGFDERIENIGSENSQLKTELETLRKEKTELDKRIENIELEKLELQKRFEGYEDIKRIPLEAEKINYGKQLLKFILKGEDITTFAISDNDISSVVHALYAIAQEGGEEFKRGSFSIEDSNKFLYKFLIKYMVEKQTGRSITLGEQYKEGSIIYPQESEILKWSDFYHKGVYSRVSSHYKGKTTQDYGIDLPELPHKYKHVLFSFIPEKDDIRPKLFIKCEEHGCGSFSELFFHLKDYIVSGKSNDISITRREKDKAVSPYEDERKKFQTGNEVVILDKYLIDDQTITDSLITQKVEIETLVKQFSDEGIKLKDMLTMPSLLRAIKTQENANFFVDLYPDSEFIESNIHELTISMMLNKHLMDSLITKKGSVLKDLALKKDHEGDIPFTKAIIFENGYGVAEFWAELKPKVLFHQNDERNNLLHIIFKQTDESKPNRSLISILEMLSKEDRIEIFTILLGQKNKKQEFPIDALLNKPIKQISKITQYLNEKFLSKISLGEIYEKDELDNIEKLIAFCKCLKKIEEEYNAKIGEEDELKENELNKDFEKILDKSINQIINDEVLKEKPHAILNQLKLERKSDIDLEEKELKGVANSEITGTSWNKAEAILEIISSENNRVNKYLLPVTEIQGSKQYTIFEPLPKSSSYIIDNDNIEFLGWQHPESADCFQHAVSILVRLGYGGIAYLPTSQKNVFHALVYVDRTKAIPINRPLLIDSTDGPYMTNALTVTNLEDSPPKSSSKPYFTGLANLLPDWLDLKWNFKKILYKDDIAKFAKIIEDRKLNIGIDILKGNSKFKKNIWLKLHPDKGGSKEEFAFVQNLKEKFQEDISFNNILNEKAQQLQEYVYKAGLIIKALDTGVNIMRVLHEPTAMNAKRVVADAAHLYGMHYGFNGFSITMPILDAGYLAYQEEYLAAAQQLATATFYMALPTALSYLWAPLGIVYAVSVTTYSTYTALCNLYSFYNEYNSKNPKLGDIAYTSLESLSSEMKALESKLKEEKGELGKKLYAYIYKPLIEKKYDLLNKVLQGEITKEEADNLKTKQISIKTEDKTYDHCVEVKNSNGEQNKKEHYHCYDEKQGLLDHIAISGNTFEVLESL